MTNENIVMCPSPEKKELPKETDKCNAEDVIFCKKCGNLVGIMTKEDRVWTILNGDGEAELEWDDLMCPIQPDINCEECAEPISEIDMTGLTMSEAKTFLDDNTPNKARKELYELYVKENKVS